MRAGGKLLGAAIAAVLTAGVAVAATRDDAEPVVVTEVAAPAEVKARAVPTTSPDAAETTTTTGAPTTTTTAAPPAPTTTAPPPPPAPPADTPVTEAATAVVTRDLTAYAGLGAWIDAYDWTEGYNRGGTPVGPADVDVMAANGVQTLYVQAARWDTFGYVMEP